MKYSIVVGIILSICVCGVSIAQNSDKNPVLVKSISKKHEGKTKRGLANGFGKAYGEEDVYEGDFKKGYPYGKGIYTWGNGNTYSGEFSKGQMDGEGTLVMKRGNQLQDSVLTGYFDKDKYLGKFKDPYLVTYTSGVRSVEFQNNDAATLNQIKFMFYANGRLIQPSLNVQDVNNTLWQNIGGYDTMVNVNYPLKDVELSFTNGSLNYSFRFNIYKEGSWIAVISL